MNPYEGITHFDKRSGEPVKVTGIEFDPEFGVVYVVLLIRTGTTYELESEYFTEHFSSIEEIQNLATSSDTPIIDEKKAPNNINEEIMEMTATGIEFTSFWARDSKGNTYTLTCEDMS